MTSPTALLRLAIAGCANALHAYLAVIQSSNTAPSRNRKPPGVSPTLLNLPGR